MSACGATHPHLPSENFCREPAAHSGQHMAHDSQGRPEYVWTAGDVWDWAPDEPAGSPSVAAPDPADVEKAARAIWESDGYRPESWGSEDVTEHTRDEYRANARAALSAVRPSPDSEAVARVAAVLPRLDREARISSFPLSFGYEDSARLIRAALGTGDREGADRG